MDPNAAVAPFLDVGTIALVLGTHELPDVLDSDGADVRFEGNTSDQRLGTSDGNSGNTVVLDLDGDDYDDLVVGSSEHPIETGEGEVFVFFGQP
jgi:hypothetical protein